MGKRLLLLPLVNAGVITSFLLLGYFNGWDLEHTRLVDLEIFKGGGEIFLAFLGMMLLGLVCNWLLLRAQFRHDELRKVAQFMNLVKGS